MIIIMIFSFIIMIYGYRFCSIQKQFVKICELINNANIKFNYSFIDNQKYDDIVVIG